MKTFYCKYNDPVYVKLEKLDLLVQLVTPENLEQTLLELREYAQEVDVDLVGKTIKTYAIGFSVICTVWE